MEQVNLMIENLLSKIEEYNPHIDMQKIIKAYNFAEYAHQGQLRNSGEVYLVHPFNVAMILADLNMDGTSIIAGLLHDVVEDTSYTYETLSKEFGEEVADLVDGVTNWKN